MEAGRTTWRQVAELRRSSLGVLAASWLLSNFLTALRPLPSNSGTLTVWKYKTESKIPKRSDLVTNLF